MNQRTRPRPRWGRISVALGVLLALVVIVTALVVRVLHSGDVLPGVRAAGVSLGGLSEADARKRLAPALRAGEPVTLVAQGRTLKVDPKRAGYAADVDATVQRAMDSGRGGPLGGVWTTFSGIFGSREVPVTVTVDQRLLRRAVATASRRIESRAFAGALVIDPDGLTVTTKPPQAGREVKRDELAARLADRLRRRAGERVDVPLKATQVVDRSTVADVGRDAQRFMRAPLRLTGIGPPLTISPAELAPLLALESLDGGRDARLGADVDALAGLVASFADERDRSAREPRLSAAGRIATLDAKDEASWRPLSARVTVKAPGRTGKSVRREALAAEIIKAIRSGDHRVKVPTQTLKPAATAQDARRMRFLIGTFTTYYAPGEPRVTNIRLIARKVDGTVIAAGGHFSLNAIAGPRTSEDGYVMAPFIANGQIVPSIGGGVSQFSTTTYNAAYFAGLQLDGHRPHSFFIDRYPAGREATLNYPDIDLTWTNDTEAPILIRTSSDETSVTVSLYGDNGGRRVRAQNGERTPTDNGDFEIVVTRVLRYPDGRVVRQPFTTRYDKPPPPEE